MSATGEPSPDDLEALFDAIASQRTETERAAPEAPAVVAAAAPPAEAIDGPEALFDRVGRLTRSLHDALRELGYDKAMEKVVDALPDARDRLTYISNLTQNAAEKALEAVETAKPLQSQLADRARHLEASWGKVFAGEFARAEFRDLALATHGFLQEVPVRTSATEQILLDIMMAQDFHDLTGQVIKKVVDLAQTVEKELLEVLMAAQPQLRAAPVEMGLAGPVVRPEGRSDIVTNQGQVDELLESLGF